MQMLSHMVTKNGRFKRFEEPMVEENDEAIDGFDDGINLQRMCSRSVGHKSPDLQGFT